MTLQDSSIPSKNAQFFRLPSVELHRSLSSEMMDSDDNPERELEAELQDQYEQYDRMGRTPPRNRIHNNRKWKDNKKHLSELEM